MFPDSRGICTSLGLGLQASPTAELSQVGQRISAVSDWLTEDSDSYIKLSPTTKMYTHVKFGHKPMEHRHCVGLFWEIRESFSTWQCSNHKDLIKLWMIWIWTRTIRKSTGFELWCVLQTGSINVFFQDSQRWQLHRFTSIFPKLGTMMEHAELLTWFTSIACWDIIKSLHFLCTSAVSWRVFARNLLKRRKSSWNHPPRFGTRLPKKDPFKSVILYLDLVIVVCGFNIIHLINLSNVADINLYQVTFNEERPFEFTWYLYQMFVWCPMFRWSRLPFVRRPRRKCLRGHHERWANRWPGRSPGDQGFSSDPC